MSETTIDSLQIEIKSSAQSAKSSIDALTSSLSKLKSATSRGAGLSSLSNQIKKFVSSSSSISSTAVSNVGKLADAIRKLDGISSIKFPSSLGKQIQKFAESVDSVNADSSKLTNLATGLHAFDGLSAIKIPSNLAKQITTIGQVSSSFNTNNASSVSAVVTSLQGFQTLSNVKIPTNIGNQLKSIATGLQQLSGIDFSVTTSLATSLQSLSDLGSVKNFSSVIKELKKLPETFSNLGASEIDSFTQKVTALASALSPLSTQIAAIGNGFANLPSNVKQSVAAVNQMTTAANSAKNSTTDLWSSVQMLYSSLKGIGTLISKAITKSNQYVETMNLFNASLGQYAQQAQEYAEMVGEKVGIDPADWMEAQGVFYNLADGFGIASDRAYTMSQQLTQLSYDLASFYNISVEDAMLKLRGSLSGEIEMMRQLGVDLSAAAMQERATAMGIQTKVTAMTQAEKAQLRYQILMERTTTAQGDMARTLSAPANQLRVLSAQVTQAARAFGNIFIPILNAVMPVVIAVAKAIRFLAACIASLFGYSLPEVEYSTGGLSTAAASAGDLSDNLGSAGGNAKKLKNALMGFDEINKLPEDSSGGGGGGGGSGGGGGLDGFDWDLATYDFLDGLVSTKIDEIYGKMQPFITWVQDHLAEIGAIVEAIGVSILAWKLSAKLIPDLSNASAILDKIKGIAALIGTIVISALLTWQFGNQFIETGNGAYLGANIISTGLLTLLSGAIIKGTFKSATAGKYAAGIALAINAGVTIAAIFKGIVKNRGENTFSGTNITSAIWATVQGAGAGFLIGGWMGATIGALLTLSVAAAIMIVETKVQLENKAKDMLWGQTSLTAKEITMVTKSLLDGIDVEATVNVLNTAISNSKQAAEDLNQKVTEFTTLINPILLGVGISEEDKASLISLLDPTNENGLIAAIQKQADTSTVSIRTTLTLVPATDSEGNDLSSNVLTSLLTIDDTVVAAATDAGNRLSQLLSDGFGEGLEETYQEQVANLTYWLQKLANGAETAELSATFDVEVEELLKGLDRDSFSEVVSEYGNLRKELYNAFYEAEKQAKVDFIAKNEQLDASAQYYLDKYNETGNESDLQEYNRILQEVRQNQLIIDAWDVEKSAANAMNQYGTEGRDKILEAVRSIFVTDEEDATNFKNVMHDDIALTKLAATELGAESTLFDTDGNLQDLTSVAKALNDGASGFLKNSFSKEDLSVLEETAEALGMSMYSLLPTDMQEVFIAQIAEMVDPSQIVPLFNEMGYEITPEVLAIFDKLGIEIPQEIRDGIEQGSTGVETATEGLTESVVDGVEGSNSEVEQASEELGKTIPDTIGDAVTDNQWGGLNQISSYISKIKKSLGGSKLGNALSNLWGKVKNTKTTSTVTTTVNIEHGTGWTTLPTDSDVDYKINLKKGWVGTLTKWISSTWSKTFTVDIKKSNRELTWTGKVRQVAASNFEFSMKKNGGYVRNGEMFIANEAGAEMVGRIGRKSAVANESQIGDAIFRYMDAHDSNDGVNEESLARAIVTGLKQAGIGSVYLNGRDMANAINAETKRTGRSAIVF